MAKGKSELGFTLTIVSSPGTSNGSCSITVSRVKQLRRWFARYDYYGQLGLYLDRDGGDSGSVWVHLSGDRAWVTHFDQLGGVDSYCRDLEYRGQDEMVEFMLSNGQVDEIHRYWTVTREEGLRALEHFLQFGDRDPTLSWVSEPESLQKTSERGPAPDLPSG